MIGVAEDHRPAELGQAVEDRGGFVAALRDVAEHDCVVDVEARKLREHGLEGAHVPVDVRQQGVRHDAITLSA